MEKLKADHLIEIEQIKEKSSGSDKSDNAMSDALNIAAKQQSDEVKRLKASAAEEFDQIKVDIQKAHEEDVSRLRKKHTEELERTKEESAASFHA